MTDLPRYLSHKIVEAAPITSINRNPNWVAITVDDEVIRIDVPANYFSRGLPSQDDMFVRYDDGYMSWSPRKAFDEGYTKVT